MERKRMNPDRLVTTGVLKPKQDLVVTKWVGLEGSFLLAKEKEQVLKEQLPGEFVDRVKGFSDLLSVSRDRKLAMEVGASAMCDVSEGGIFGALWEMAATAGVGLEVDIKKIPIRQETIEICEVFDINPYLLISGGALLIGADNGNYLVETLKKAGIHAAVVGYATEGNDRVVVNREERRFLEPPRYR